MIKVYCDGFEVDVIAKRWLREQAKIIVVGDISAEIVIVRNPSPQRVASLVSRGYSVIALADGSGPLLQRAGATVIPDPGVGLRHEALGLYIKTAVEESQKENGRRACD